MTMITLLQFVPLYLEYSSRGHAIFETNSVGKCNQVRKKATRLLIARHHDYILVNAEETLDRPTDSDRPVWRRCRRFSLIPAHRGFGRNTVTTLACL